MFHKFDFSDISYYLANQGYTHIYDRAYNIKYILTWNVVAAQKPVVLGYIPEIDLNTFFHQMKLTIKSYLVSYESIKLNI